MTFRKTLHAGRLVISALSAIGIDTLLSTAANLIVPGGAGLFGAAQKICVRVGVAGLSMLAADAIDRRMMDTINEACDKMETSEQTTITEFAA